MKYDKGRDILTSRDRLGETGLSIVDIILAIVIGLAFTLLLGFLTGLLLNL